jgi:hypothetical protein
MAKNKAKWRIKNARNLTKEGEQAYVKSLEDCTEQAEDR